MSGHPGYYRYRLGDFRAGFEIHDGVIVFLRCLHRREIYRFFP
jgi:mRNA interferase RelE/StbE